MKTKPTRRLMGLLLSIAMTMALIPALPALGAVTNPDAELTEGKVVLAKADRSFSVKVNAGLQPLNAVLINFPTAFNGIVTDQITPTKDGWTVRRINSGEDHALLYTGGTIASTGSATFDFLGDVGPVPGDATGAFRIQVSSNGGSTFTNAPARTPGALDATVKVLEIISLGYTAGQSSLITDGTGTSTQTLGIDVAISNLASGPVTVSELKLDSSGGEDAKKTSVTLPQGTSTHPFEVTLDSLSAGSSAARTFTASTVGPTHFPNSVPSLPYTVQGIPQLEVTDLEPTFFKAGEAATATATVVKTAVQDVTVDSVSSLTFAETTMTLQADEALDFSGGNSDTVDFETTSVDGAEIREGYRPALELVATDANGFGFTSTKIKDDIRLFIDAFAPVVIVDTLKLPSSSGVQQLAVKNGDKVTIEGSVEELFAWSVTGATLTTDGATGKSYDGTVTTTDERFSAAFTLTELPTDATRLDFTVTVEDQALRTTPATLVDAAGLPVSIEVDIANPVIEPDGEILLNEDSPLDANGDSVPASVLVYFEETGLPKAQDAAAVYLSNAYEEDVLRGACDPSRYSVTATGSTQPQLVTGVRYGDGKVCEAGAAGPDNARILVLSTPVDRNATLSVKYNPPQTSGVSDEGSDDAALRALEGTATAVSRIAPVLPEILQAFRNTSSDPDCRDEGSSCESAFTETIDGTLTFWTRFTGSDLQVEFGKGRTGWAVQVVDETGSPISGVGYDLSESRDVVQVPVGLGPGTYRRGIRFVGNQKLGEIAWFDVVVDKELPELTSVSFTDATTFAKAFATATFSETLVAGTDHAADWRIYEVTGMGKKVYYSPDAVSKDGVGSDQRRLEFTRQYDPATTTMGGARYEVLIGHAYADKAGNLADTKEVARAS